GNVTPQLHLHVIGRRRDDAAWPKPVWGQGEGQPYEEQARRDAVRLARERLSPRGS
ncbi:MAG TPA: diadenosine tetraphosphate hydrolase, partial [Caulobacteraceae bacterium]